MARLTDIARNDFVSKGRKTEIKPKMTGLVDWEVNPKIKLSNSHKNKLRLNHPFAMVIITFIICFCFLLLLLFV